MEVLDALSASGLRAMRYTLEIDGASAGMNHPSAYPILPTPLCVSHHQT